MIYTLTPMESCNGNVTMAVIIVIVAALTASITRSVNEKNLSNGIIIVAFILLGLVLDSDEPPPPENRVVTGTLLQLSEVRITNDHTKLGSYTVMRGVYEVEGGKQIVTTSDNRYPNKAVFYANKQEACKGNKK